MAEFCSCGSLIFKGNCTNKNCTGHKKSFLEPVTYKQEQLINELVEETDYEYADEINFKTMTKSEASDLIEKLMGIRDLMEG